METWSWEWEWGNISYGGNWNGLANELQGKAGKDKEKDENNNTQKSQPLAQASRNAKKNQKRKKEPQGQTVKNPMSGHRRHEQPATK